MTQTRIARSTTLLLVLVLFTAAARACPACYGAADSPMTAGMNTAIMTMVGIITFVLSGIVAFTIMMRKRLQRFAAAAEHAAESTEHN